MARGRPVFRSEKRGVPWADVLVLFGGEGRVRHLAALMGMSDHTVPQWKRRDMVPTRSVETLKLAAAQEERHHQVVQGPDSVKEVAVRMTSWAFDGRWGYIDQISQLAQSLRGFLLLSEPGAQAAQATDPEFQDVWQKVEKLVCGGASIEECEPDWTERAVILDKLTEVLSRVAHSVPLPVQKAP